MDEVINKIKELRISKGFSHENMAHELEISQAAYTKLENKETKLSVDRLFQIAKILETSADKLLGATASAVFNQNNSDHAIGYQQQVENLSQENRETNKDFIEALKLDIIYLKEQNVKLMDILSKK